MTEELLDLLNSTADLDFNQKKYGRVAIIKTENMKEKNRLKILKSILTAKEKNQMEMSIHALDLSFSLKEEDKTSIAISIASAEKYAQCSRGMRLLLNREFIDSDYAATYIKQITSASSKVGMLYATAIIERALALDSKKQENISTLVEKVSSGEAVPLVENYLTKTKGR